MVIRQISFDFWNTLFRANPAYAEARNKYLTESPFNVKRMEPEEVYDAYKRVDNVIDWLTERQGFTYRPIQLYAMICYELQCDVRSNRDLRPMAEAFYSLFAAHPPSLYDDDTLPVLRELRARGYGLNIASNTGFITGAVLRKVAISVLPVDFTFGIYSDELPYAKPHRLFFDEVVNWCSGLSPHEVLHVGDNAKTDYLGAIQAGLEALLINTSTLTIKDVLTTVP